MTQDIKTRPKPRYPRCGKIHAAFLITCGDCGMEAPLDGRSRQTAEWDATRRGWIKIGWWRCSPCFTKSQKGEAA